MRLFFRYKISADADNRIEGIDVLYISSEEFSFALSDLHEIKFLVT